MTVLYITYITVIVIIINRSYHYPQTLNYKIASGERRPFSFLPPSFSFLSFPSSPHLSSPWLPPSRPSLVFYFHPLPFLYYTLLLSSLPLP